MRAVKTNTITTPSDYLWELRSTGQRKKARCFQEYCIDMELGEHNSYSFYSKSWEVGKGTAHRWVKDFNYALEIFDAGRELKRVTHFKKAIKNDSAEFCKKSGGTIGTIEVERQNINKSPISSALQKVNGTSGTSGTSSVEPSIYINNNNALLDKDFYRFISEIKMSIKNVGQIEDIYKSYLKIKPLVDLQTLSKIYREYASETKSDRKVGLSRFIDDLMYLSYCKPYVKIQNEDNVIIGVYDKDNEILISEDKNYGLTLSRFSELNSSNQLEVIKYVG